jgi:LmbE family N-acetylglucosaminyl deacetylase
MHPYLRAVLLVAAGSLCLMPGRPLRSQSQPATPQPSDPYLWNNRPPDPAFKADILVVVAHPDDEVMVAAYLAREVLDHHKRVAVVFQNPGDGGNNAIGPEQARALGDLRRVEARRALGSLGITNIWFLDGHDTTSQNVLDSLEHCEHGRCLDQLVRVMRITRPTVVLTWLPDFTTGENHADHQAAGVLATEAFDLAGDPVAFPEQVSPVQHPDGNMNLTEGLRPWQPEKIYYFYNPTHDIFAGQGPQYSSSEISPSRHVSYAVLAATENTYHETQGGQEVAQAIANHTLATSQNEIAKIATAPVKLIFGKSLVPSGITDDVFTGTQPAGVAYQPPSGYRAAKLSAPVMTIGDPWLFYQRFWQAHGVSHLASLVPYEVTVKVGGTLIVPLVLHNPSGEPLTVSFSEKVPQAWRALPLPPVVVPPHDTYFVRFRAQAPEQKLTGWQPIQVSAEAAGKTLGTIAVRAELSTGWVAPQ